MKAFGERIVTIKIMEDNKIGGISTSSNKVYNNTVTVVSIGDDVVSNLSSGDILKLSENSGTEMKDGGVDYLVIVKQNILATL